MARRTIIVTIAIMLVALLAVGVVAGIAPNDEHDEHEHAISGIDYDEDRNMVWSIDHDLDDDVTLVGYDVESGTVEHTETFEQGDALEYVSGYGVFVASGDTLYLYSPDEGEVVQEKSFDGIIEDIAYDDWRWTVWVAHGDAVQGYFVEDDELVSGYTVHTEGIGSIAYADDHLITATTWGDEAVIHHIEGDGDVLHDLQIPDENDGLGAVEITDDGDVFVAGEETIYQFDRDSGELVSDDIPAHIFGTSEIIAVPDEELLISVGFDNNVHVYDLTAEETIEVYEHDDTIYTADVDLTNEYLWIGDGEDQPGTVTALDISEVLGDMDENGDDGTPDDSTPDDSTPDDGTPDDGTPDDGIPANGDNGDDNGDETDDDSIPGFGAALAAIAMVGAALLAYRRAN